VRGNWFSLSVIATPSCQTGPRASTGKFCQFSGGFGLTPMALAGGRGRAARQCARSGAVLRWAGHEKAGAKQKPGCKPPWKRAVLSRLARFRNPGWGPRRHRVRRYRGLERPEGPAGRAGQKMLQSQRLGLVAQFTQGSSFLAILGFEMESRWDSMAEIRMRAVAWACEAGRFSISEQSPPGSGCRPGSRGH
jgi:hypothetical protein